MAAGRMSLVWCTIMKPSEFIWCERSDQWRAVALGKCRGCGKGKGKGCVNAPQVKTKKKKRVAKGRKV